MPSCTIKKKVTAVALAIATSLLAIGASSAWAQKVKAPPAPIFSTENEKCIVPAAQYHGVNYFVLRAILKVESGLNPNAVGRNNNGTVDVGMGQMNSMHFRDLAKFGIEPGHLRDPCISTYVAAWHLKKNLIASGNTWEGIARYHSATPYFNQRYQILLKNEMIRSGAMTGSLQAVPNINRFASGRAVAMANTQGGANVPASLLVVDATDSRQ